ncbi:hypothetical protein [Sporolactobacillus terrae]|uniref:hypothetical protein n=1 Tax=Sporolactobacillus terrae TaxID=269673 RepID=UPI001CC140A3|nr:hypothetical protein [Sporolactobacillus terrae]UAK17548.1 hypothetical protein K7399_06375 [Sporolactobacillus terrae]
MKWPYENIGVLTTRAFRNLLNKIFGDIGSDMQEQKTRVDNLINGVEQPSEVVDMRTGRDGQTYPVARDMVLGEIGKTEAAQAKINQNNAAQLAEKANLGSGATVIIATATSSDREKKTANFVCTGVNDEVVFAQAINSLPRFQYKCVGGIFMGPTGKVLICTGKLNFGTRYSVPDGAHLIIDGIGRCYQDLAFGGNGGTIIAGTDPNGVFIAPYKTGYGDNQTVIIRNLDFRQDAVQTHNADAVNLQGLMCGGLDNVGVINDKNISGVQCQDGNGLNFNNGALGNICWVNHIEVGAFGATGGRYNAILASNHLVVDDVQLNGGSAVSNGLLVGMPGDKFTIGNIHFFGFGTPDNTTENIQLIRVGATSTSKLRATLLIRNIAYESIYGRGSTNAFIHFDDDKAEMIIDRVNANSSNDVDLLYNAHSQVYVGRYTGTKIGQARGGFSLSTPTIPDLNVQVKNNYPYSVIVYLVTTGVGTEFTGELRIADESGNSRNLGSLRSVLLPPGFSIFFTQSVPAAWYWCGV